MTVVQLRDQKLLWYQLTSHHCQEIVGSSYNCLLYWVYLCLVWTYVCRYVCRHACVIMYVLYVWLYVFMYACVCMHACMCEDSWICDVVFYNYLSKHCIWDNGDAMCCISNLIFLLNFTFYISYNPDSTRNTAEQSILILFNSAEECCCINYRVSVENLTSLS